MKKIAIIGDYNQNEESHRLIMESIKEVAEEIQGDYKRCIECIRGTFKII